MWNPQFLFLSFSGVVLFALLCVPGEAIDNGAVDYMKGELSLSLEKEREYYCGVCTFFCPRVLDRIRTWGIGGLNVGEDPLSLLLQRSNLTTLIEPLQKLASEGGSSIECESTCTPLVKDPLNRELDDRQHDFQSMVQQGIETYPFTSGVLDKAVELLREEIETEDRDLFTCKNNVEDRSKYTEVRANSAYSRHYFKVFYNWN